MQIPRFNIIDKVGEGAMSIVWKARQESLDRTVALKTLKPHVAEDPDEIRALLKEARAAAALKHQNVVQVYDIGEAEGLHYIVMEFIDGPTVGRLLEQRNRLPDKQALSIVIAVGEALEYAWSKASLIHRDIKPHNILIDSDGTVKLSDLGIAKLVDAKQLSTQLREGVLAGTPNYIAPEQARCSEDIDFRCDMYALGATLYHMVTGRIPFGDLPPMKALEMQISGRLPNPRDISPDVSAGVAQLIGRLMRKDPARRFDSWRTAIDVVKRTAAGRARLEGPAAFDGSTVSPSAISAAPTPAAAGRDAARSRTTVGSRIHGLAWMILIVLWAFLGYRRLHQPPLEFVSDSPAEAVRPDAAPTTVSPPATQPAPTQPAPTQPALTQPDGAPTARPVEPSPHPVEPSPHPVEPAAPVIAPPGTHPAATAVVGPLDNTLRVASQFLYAENFRRAAEFVAAEARANPNANDKATLDEISAFIGQIAAAVDDIPEAFMGQVGREVKIFHDNRQHSVLLRAVAAGKAIGTLATPEGPKPIEFMIDKLDAAERNRWLGRADTPARSALKLILYLKTGDLEAAAELASRCGPLSGVFGAEIRDRMKAKGNAGPSPRSGAG